VTGDKFLFPAKWLAKLTVAQLTDGEGPVSLPWQGLNVKNEAPLYIQPNFPPGSNVYYATGLLSAQTSQSTINVIFLFPVLNPYRLVISFIAFISYRMLCEN